MNSQLSKIIFITLFLYSHESIASDWLIDFGKIGPIKVGMKEDDIKKILKQSKRQNWQYRNPFGDECFHLSYEDVSFQFMNGALEDIAVYRNNLRMKNGIGIGSTLSDIESLFGKGSRSQNSRVLIHHNHYDSETPQITVQPPEAVKKSFGDAPASIQFEFNHGPLRPESKVESISIGMHPVEGCA